MPRWMEVCILSSNRPTIEQIDADRALREFFAERPKDVHGINNRTAAYWRRWMLSKIIGRWKIGGVPETWDYDYFLTHLFIDGYICITDTELGNLALKCGYAGINVFEHPTECIVANPILGSFRRTIGADCVLVKILHDYSGVIPMLDRYSYLLSACDSSIAVNLLNSKVTFIGHAHSKAQAETMKAAYDQIAMGKPIVVMDTAGKARNEPATYDFLPVKQSYIADAVDELKMFIRNEFLEEWGYPASNTRKAERQTLQEICGVQGDYLVAEVLDNIREGFEQANKMFGLNLSIELKEMRSFGGVSNASGDQVGEEAGEDAEPV